VVQTPVDTTSAAAAAADTGDTMRVGVTLLILGIFCSAAWARAARRQCLYTLTLSFRYRHRHRSVSAHALLSEILPLNRLLFLPAFILVPYRWSGTA